MGVYWFFPETDTNHFHAELPHISFEKEIIQGLFSSRKEQLFQYCNSQVSVWSHHLQGALPMHLNEVNQLNKLPLLETHVRYVY